MEKKNFFSKYAPLLYLGAVIIFFIILKLIGFPEILSK